MTKKHIEMKVKKGQLRKKFILNKKMSTNCIDKIFRYLDNTTVGPV